MHRSRRDKQTRQLKAQCRRARFRRRRSRHVVTQRLRIGDVQLQRLPVHHRDRRRVPVLKLHRQLQMKRHSRRMQFLSPDLVEQPCATVSNYRHARHRIPHHISKSAQGRKLGTNLIPVRMPY